MSTKSLASTVTAAVVFMLAPMSVASAQMYQSTFPNYQSQSNGQGYSTTPPSSPYALPQNYGAYGSGMFGGMGFGLSNVMNYFSPYGSGNTGYATHTTPFGSSVQASNNYNSWFGSGSVNASYTYPGYLINQYGPYGSGTSSLTSYNPGLLGLFGGSPFGNSNQNNFNNSNNFNSSCFTSSDESDFEDKWDRKLTNLVDKLSREIDNGDITTVDELRREENNFQDDFDNDLQDAQDQTCDSNVRNDLDDYDSSFRDDIRSEFNSLRAQV